MNEAFINTWLVLTAREKRKFITLIVESILISLADILSLVILLWIINFYISPLSSAPSFLPEWLLDKNSITVIGIFLALFTVKNIAGFFITRAQDRFSGEVAVRISRNCLDRYQRTGYMEFVNTDSSTLIRRIAMEPFEFTQTVLSGLQQILTQIFLVIISISAILVFNARLFLLLLVILLPPAIIVFHFIKKRLADAREKVRKENERSYQKLLEAMKGYVESNIFQKNEFFMERFMKHRREFGKQLYRSISLQQFPSRAIEIFAILGLFMLLLIAKMSGPANGNQLLLIGAFMAAAYKIIPGLVKIINLSGQVKAYKFSPEDLVYTEPGQPVSFSIQPIHSLSINDISFTYSNQELFRNISFTLQKGEIAGIGGLSGKGKTTFMSLLLGFLSPQSGTISINNEVMSVAGIKKYWPSISYVKQQSFFIHDSILRNITLEEEVTDKASLELAMEMTGLDKMLEIFPEGLDKIITENGKNISGGQQQRIAIARALYKRSDLLLLDEPFNELDEESTLFIMEQLKEFSATGKIILLITHDKKILSLCTKLISLDESFAKNFSGS